MHSVLASSLLIALMSVAALTPLAAAEPSDEATGTSSLLGRGEAALGDLTLEVRLRGDADFLPQPEYDWGQPLTSPTLALRKRISPEAALRARLGLSLYSENLDEGQLSGRELSVGLDYLYFLAQGVVSPYLVGGADLLLQGGDFFESHLDLGVSGGVGAEVKVLDHLTLGAESRVGLALAPARLGTLQSRLFVGVVF